MGDASGTDDDELFGSVSTGSLSSDLLLPPDFSTLPATHTSNEEAQAVSSEDQPKFPKATGDKAVVPQLELESAIEHDIHQTTQQQAQSVPSPAVQQSNMSPKPPRKSSRGVRLRPASARVLSKRNLVRHPSLVFAYGDDEQREIVREHRKKYKRKTRTRGKYVYQTTNGVDYLKRMIEMHEGKPNDTMISVPISSIQETLQRVSDCESTLRTKEMTQQQILKRLQPHLRELSTHAPSNHSKTVPVKIPESQSRAKLNGQKAEALSKVIDRINHSRSQDSKHHVSDGQFCQVLIQYTDIVKGMLVAYQLASREAKNHSIHAIEKLMKKLPV